MPIPEEQRSEYLRTLCSRAEGSGGKLAQDAQAACSKLLLWLHYLATKRDSLCAKELLVGARAAMLEAVTYTMSGLGRAAINAIRTQIDLLLAFTYFCDHPREWEAVVAAGDGFKLRGDVYRYHEDINKEFKQRLAMMEQASSLSLVAIYRILSAHIHGQSKFTVPKAGEMKELICSESFAESIVKLQQQVAEAVSNFLFAIYAADWAELPPAIVSDAKSKLSDKQRAAFFPS